MESGHNKNVANLQTTTIVLTNLGSEYSPPQDLIKLPEMQTLLTASQTALSEVDTAQAAKTVATDDVQAEFEGLPKYVVNIKRQAQIELNDAAFTADLQTIVNKFAPPGRRTGVPDDPLTPDIDESRTSQSQSQRSRDNQIAYLADISALLKTKSAYKATGTLYDVATIDAKIASLTAKNNAAVDTVANLGNKLDARDAVMYNDQTGIIPRIKLTKTYLILKFGKTSAAYQQINALEFRKVQ
ncbi:hypothetical protein BH10ACI1_BH10ACI1_09850 [soil metagenome]